MSAKILVVDDDKFLLENLDRLLSAQGYEVRTSSSGEEGLHEIVKEAPDLLVLDLGLPGVDGVSLCRRVRSKWRFPVIMLTARTDAMDKVIGLEVGADDYLTKPFEPSELIARVRAQLRRVQEYQVETPRSARIEVGDLMIDEDSRDAFVNGEAAGLTTKEYELLAYLAQNKGRALSRERLFEEVWGYDIEFSSNSLDVFVYRLRQKLPGNTGTMLQTVRGYGYKLQTP
ncbi:MAG: response regulator transcription factor [Armatimonadetes bacterium]|nr:response regulator transcription factor [Armatimonadota bacterium]